MPYLQVLLQTAQSQAVHGCWMWWTLLQPPSQTTSFLMDWTGMIQVMMGWDNDWLTEAKLVSLDTEVITGKSNMEEIPLVQAPSQHVTSSLK